MTRKKGQDTWLIFWSNPHVSTHHHTSQLCLVVSSSLIPVITNHTYQFVPHTWLVVCSLSHLFLTSRVCFAIFFLSSHLPVSFLFYFHLFFTSLFHSSFRMILSSLPIEMQGTLWLLCRSRGSDRIMLTFSTASEMHILLLNVAYNPPYIFPSHLVLNDLRCCLAQTSSDFLLMN